MITNQAKPSTSLSNATKINTGIVWDLDLNTWDTELQTWQDTATTIDNVTKISSSITNVTKTA